MDIVIAAEKPSIAGLLSEHLHCPVNPQDISVRPNPSEIGSFLISWRLNRYLLSPGGHIMLRGIRVGGPAGTQPCRSVVCQCSAPFKAVDAD